MITLFVGNTATKAWPCLISPHPTPAESPSPSGRGERNGSLVRYLSKTRQSTFLLPWGEGGPLGPDEGRRFA